MVLLRVTEYYFGSSTTLNGNSSKTQNCYRNFTKNEDGKKFSYSDRRSWQLLFSATRLLTLLYLAHGDS